MKMIASGRKPEIKIEKMIRRVAIELREAKKPLVVEKRPTRAIAKIGRLMSGVRKMLSIPWFQERM